MTDPITERIRQIIYHHRPDTETHGGEVACGCGLTRLTDHSRHVAEEIVNRLGLRPDYVNDVRKRVRYVSALFDEELTTLEGAE